MQFQVPQFIETEDKIVGPLTIKQFVYISGAAGVSFMLYFTVQTWLWFILSVFVVGGALAMALVKINGQPLPKIIVAAASYYWQPQTYVWQPENPETPKNESTIKEFAGGAFSLENIVSGLALRNARQYVQTGSKSAESLGDKLKSLKPSRERYQIFRRITGERHVAKRVDYR
jgi:hypothetical protein